MQQLSHLMNQIKSVLLPGSFFEDDYVNKKINILSKFGISTSPSGGAGIAALIYAKENQLFGINKESSPLVFLTEGAV